MRKLFFGIFAVAITMLATSCQKENELELGGEALISFNIGVENGALTRAIGDGLKTDTLIYAVYDKDGILIKSIKGADTNGQLGKTAFNGGLTDNVTISLAKGNTYTVAFWAQNKACEAYTTTDLQNVKIDYTNALNNDETRDAFFADTTFTVTSSTSMNVTMKRPFAQINVGVTVDDFEAAVGSGVTVEQSKVVIDDAATSLNVLTGAVSGDTTFTYNIADIPTLNGTTAHDTLYVDSDNDGINEKYIYLSMSYILVNDATNGASKATLNSLEYTFKTTGSDIELKEGLNSVPVQRNWRTNIVGKLLTGDITFNIIIDPNFDNDNNQMIVHPTEVEEDEEGVYIIKKESDLLYVAQQINTDAEAFVGKTIRLANDLNFASITWTPLNLWTNETANLACIDGAGHKISNLSIKGAGSLGFIGSYASKDSVLTIKDITFENPVVESSASIVGTVVGNTNGNMNFENVTVTGANLSSTAQMGIRIGGIGGIGGIVGLYPVDAKSPLNFNNCIVENSTITGYHNLSGIAGSIMGSNATMTNCQSKNNTFYHRAVNPASWQNYDANGYAEGNSAKTGCTTTGNTGVQAPIVDGVFFTAEGYAISNAAGMTWFADQVNVSGNTFAGKTVELTEDIDLGNMTWTPIGTNADDAKKFQGTFDGKDKTIKNLKVQQGAAYHAAGLFGALNGTVKNLIIDGAEITSISQGNSNGDTDNGTAVVAGSIYNTGLIENVTVKNATVNGNRYVAGIAGYVYGKIKNCRVENSNITAACDNLTGSWDNGDKVGGIAGYFPLDSDNYIDGCSVNEVIITGYRDLGGIVGNATGVVTNNTVESGVIINVDKTHDYKAYDSNNKYDANSIIGEGTAGAGNTGDAEINFK